MTIGNGVFDAPVIVPPAPEPPPIIFPTVVAGQHPMTASPSSVTSIIRLPGQETGTTTNQSEVMRLFPIYIPKVVRVSQFYWRGTANMPTNCVQGVLYNCRANDGWPGTLVTVSRDVPLSNLPTLTSLIDNATIVLQPGWYWIGAKRTTNSTIPQFRYLNGQLLCLHVSASGAASVAGLAYNLNNAATLPAPADLTGASSLYLTTAMSIGLAVQEIVP